MSARPARIVLVGFSGSGKSSVAPLVAAALGWLAVDTDDLVQQQAGRPVAEIFEPRERRRSASGRLRRCGMSLVSVKL